MESQIIELTKTQHELYIAKPLNILHLPTNSDARSSMMCLF